MVALSGQYSIALSLMNMLRSFFRLAAIHFALLFLFGGAVLAQDGVTYNTMPFDSLNPSPSGRYSALWGYTAPDGREYALLGGFTGTHIIDITEKPIREVALIKGPASGWREMKTRGEYAYVVSEGGGGLQIIDLSGLPDAAELVVSDTNVFRTGHTITQEDDWLYVHGSDVQAGVNQGTLIFSIADDPEKPVLVGMYDRGYVHDAQIRNDTMYAAMIEDGRLDIVYLGKDRSEPKLVTDISYAGAGTHNSDLTLDGRYVMTTDEVGTTDKTLKVWDIGDLDDIVKVVDWTADSNSIIHNVHIRGTVAYISWYMAGTRIVDISDPLNPVELGFYDWIPGSGERYAGNWEVYPYFESGKIISSDMSRGLYVFTFDGAKKGLANGVVRDAVSGEALAGVRLELTGLGKTIYTNAEGKFQVLAGEGEVGYNALALNYRRKEGSFSLTSDGTDVVIYLEPLKLRDVQIVAVDDITGEPIQHFAFNLGTRGEGKVDTPDPEALHLPVDSGFAVTVGAWGWLPKVATIDPNIEGDLVVRLERGYADDAELDLGWTLGEPDDDGVGGEWERGVPVGLQVLVSGTNLVTVEPDMDHTPGTGQQAFMTKIADSPEMSPGLADVDSGRVTLTSPSFDLTGYTRPYLSFALWYSNDALPVFPADDKLYVRLSNDGGQSWTDVLTLDHGLLGWEEYTLNVADYVQPSAEMKFRVVASDSGGQGWNEAGLDDFVVVDSAVSAVAGEQLMVDMLQFGVIPNPVSSNCLLRVEAPGTVQGVRIDVFDGLGRHRKSLYRGVLQSGETTLNFDVRGYEAGVYHVRLLLPDGTQQMIPVTVL